MSTPTILPLYHNQELCSNNFSTRDPDSQAAKELKITQQELQERPWKYIGYRVFSRWLGYEKSLLVVRQFASLNARIVLSLQDEVSVLEDQLEVLETSYSQPGPDDHDNGSFRRDIHGERKVLLDKIHNSLEKYNRFINEYERIQRHPTASKTSISFVKRWLRIIYPNAIAEEETRFIDHEEDLISLRANDLDIIGEHIKSLLWALNFFPRILQRQPPDPLIIDGNTVWYDVGKVKRVTSLIVSVAGLVIFIIPFWVLNRCDSLLAKQGLIMGFVICFYVTVALATTARTFESLGSAAAYAAVLMVFLQVGSNNDK